MALTTDDPMRPARYRVVRNRRETHDTFTLDLVPADGGPCLAFAPGQFNMLYLFGIGEVPNWSYQVASLCVIQWR
jgi:NAD(P)H-flavin reductase